MFAPRRTAPRVYIITDRHATGGQPLDEVVARLLRLLAETRLSPSSVAIQLREKDLSGRAMLQLASALRALTAPTGVRLFVNDRVDVALAAGADGVHLGGGSLSVDDVSAVAPHLDIALSTHDEDDVARAAADPRIDFVVFGPVFDTPSKRPFGPPRGVARLQAACSSPVPVIALGGIQSDNISACFRAGAWGVAAIRAFMQIDASKDPQRRFFEAIEDT